jgi:hypothetical protein
MNEEAARAIAEVEAGAQYEIARERRRIACLLPIVEIGFGPSDLNGCYESS